MRRRISLAIAIGAVVSLPLTVTSATAADLDAPNARAAAKVSAAGTLVSGKNVVSSQRVAKGRYCVRVNSTVSLRNAVVLATPNSGRQTTLDVRRAPTGTCGFDASSITVYTYNAGYYADTWFTVAVL
ncbi:hypothetical protein GCM10010387_31970 [Streptomyces inusitatus]|uniref:SH3b domain-containing protein n=1 Tax=Streptomyces inusitatus TaxID=68221 RepID=A0A918Q7V7_9ACTN|nr:hypothetical protein [Streptomyces inusitatus]GGZ35509.1 hypothetical protein GCM10010387_31970 [Streptomyces inusitatus]